MTWLHWIVEQFSRFRAKKAGAEVTGRVNASGVASDADREAVEARRDAEYRRLEQERAERRNKTAN
jgi:hypothetical protein